MDFCAWLTIAPELTGVPGPISYIEMFVDRVRVGALVVNNAIVKNRTMEGYLRDVAQISAGMGAKYPR